MPPKAAPAHPKYEDMVKAAILALKDRNGSSVPAIAKYVGSNFKLPGNFKKILSTQLKNLVKSGKLVKVKASYKLGEALKKAPKKPRVVYVTDSSDEEDPPPPSAQQSFIHFV